MKDFVCIVCPKGCRLHVDVENDFAVTGNSCPRGEIYGNEEASSPTRMITSTVAVENGFYRRLPVKTDSPIPKGLIFDAMKTLDGISIKAPVKTGQLIVENICGTGVSFIAARDMQGAKNE